MCIWTLGLQIRQTTYTCLIGISDRSMINLFLQVREFARDQDTFHTAYSAAFLKMVSKSNNKNLQLVG